MSILVEIERPGRPGRPGHLVRADAREDVVAIVSGDNPLDTNWQAPARDADPLPLILWSGSLGGGLFDAHPHTWGAPGWERLEEVCRVLEPGPAGPAVCFRSHARHVLSDAPSCFRFVQEHDAASFGLALDPAACLEGSMLPDLEDHLERIFALVGGHASYLFLSDVARTAEGDVTAVALGRGVLPRDHVRALLDRHVPATTPIVLMDDDVPAQRDWLGTHLSAQP